MERHKLSALLRQNAESLEFGRFALTESKGWMTAGNKLLDGFERTGSKDHLNMAIEIIEQAIGLTPIGHPDRAMSFNIFGNPLARRFEMRGSMEDQSCDYGKGVSNPIHPKRSSQSLHVPR